MAKVSEKTVINCGTTHVTGTVFSVKNGALYLEQFVNEHLSYDYSNEDSWGSAVGNALQVIASRIKPKGDVVLVVPGQYLITKDAKIAAITDESRRREFYSFEAAAQFQRLFPLNELVWDAQSINCDEIEEELVFFAMKRDSANRLIERARVAGLKPTQIQPNTILDIQTYRYLENLNGTLGETVLILNVGAKTSNLTYVGPSGFSVNNINVGGNFVTQTIAEAQGLDFEKAERLKLEVFAVYNSTGVFPQNDVGGVVAAACDKFIRRLSKEITLRLVGLRKRGDKPVRIFTLGRGRLAPGFDKTLSQLQKMPTERLSVTDFIEISPFVPEGDVKMNGAQLQEAVGVAASLVVPNLPSVNLFPRELQEVEVFKKQLPWYILGGVCLAIAPWFVWATTKKEVAQSRNDVRAQQVATAGLYERQKEVENLQRGITNSAHYVDLIDDILKNRYNWNAVLDDLQKTLIDLQSLTMKDSEGELVPANDRHVWIESLNVKRTYVPGKEAGEDSEAVPARIACDLVVTFKLLLPEIDAQNPVHNASVFGARLKEIRESLARNMRFAAQNGITDSANLTSANLPTITFTIRLKDKEEI